MSEPSIDARLQAIEERLEQVYASAEKTRKYILAMVVVAVVGLVVPLIGLAFAIPAYLTTLGDLAGI